MALKRRLTRLLSRANLLPFLVDLYLGLGALPAWLRARRRGAPGTGPELPLPGPFLRLSAAGTADLGWFLAGGERAARSIEEALAGVGARLEELGSLLEFGCGCGRVLRHWADLDGPAVHGTDYNPRAVAWCRRHLPFATLYRNHLAPPLPLPDAGFDLVYALSVFTHLPEALQRAWLSELARVLEPGGWLLVTTHGAAYEEALLAEERERFQAGRLVVRGEEAAGTNLCGAYHPRRYVEERLAPGCGFEVAAFHPQGAQGNPRQDLWVLRKAGEARATRQSV